MNYIDGIFIHECKEQEHCGMKIFTDEISGSVFFDDVKNKNNIHSIGGFQCKVYCPFCGIDLEEEVKQYMLY